MSRKQENSVVQAESGLIRPLDGFPSLADALSSDPDQTCLVFKRFSKLAARNLLYLQSELADLQAQQDRFDMQDQSLEHGDLESKRCAMNWESFKEAAKVPDSSQYQRMALVKKIREKMKEYS